MALGLLGIGFGAVHWAKTLMPDEEVVEERHPMRATDESRDRVVEVLKEGGASSQITRRPMIKYTLGGALGLFAVPLVLQVAGSLGPMPQNSLSQTFWNGGPSGPGQDPTFKPLRLMRDPENTPIKAEDVTIGSVFHVMPRGPAARPRSPATAAPRTSSRRRPRRPCSSCASTRTSSSPRSSATGATTASSPTPRSAPTSVVRSASTSSRRTTCSARATSRPST